MGYKISGNKIFKFHIYNNNIDMMNVSNVIERLREIMEDETLDQLKEELAGFHSADLADIFQELKPEERLECFKLLDIEKAAELMEYLSPQMQVELLGDIDQEVASKILTKLPHDAAADVLGDMEEDESETYLDKLSRISFQKKSENFLHIMRTQQAGL